MASERNNNGVVNDLPRALSARQAKFVEVYLATADGEGAAAAAGYSGSNLSNAAWRLLHRCPQVQQAILDARTRVVAKGERTAEKMLEQLDADRQFAFEKGHAMAAVKASEVSAKIQGLLIDKIDGRISHGLQVIVQKFGDSQPPLLEAKDISDA